MKTERRRLVDEISDLLIFILYFHFTLMTTKLKVILIGESGVGKTNLIIRFAKDSF